MWRAIGRGVLWALPVLALGVFSQLWLQHTLEARAIETQRELGSIAARSLDETQTQLRARLEDLCRFDRRVERLRAELSAPPPRVDARRSLTAMANTLGVAHLAAHAPGQSRPLAESEAATEDPAKTGALRLRAQCTLANGVELRAALHYVPAASALPRFRVSLAPAVGEDWQRVWPVQSQPADAALWLDQPSTAQPAAAIQVATALGCVLAFGLGLLFGAGRGASQAESSTLLAIERAAQQVARGDLASQIGLSTGTEADRTIGAFNRMTEELRDARERLMKAERAAAWQDMARRIAHEIKNPLSPIRTAMETLRKAHARRLPEFDEIFDESSQAILEEVERLQHIVREFSEFARLPKPRPGAIDVRDTTQHAISVVRHQGANLLLEAPSDLPAARADREQLTQVLLNLLQNACAAANEARAAGARVRVALRARPSGIVVEVHDNGPGVPEALRESIFQPYFTQREGGSGLGLAIAARIVEEHGGTLQVGDSPDGGALFAFELPLEPSGAPANPLATPC